MILIGITGAIGHGKSTLAEALHVYEPNLLHLETNMPIIEIANQLQHSLQVPLRPGDIEGLNHWLHTLPIAVERVVRRSVGYDTLKLSKDQIESNPSEYEKLFVYLEHANANPDMLTVEITPFNKGNPEYRPLLQWIGGYLVHRLDPLVWTAEVIERAREFADTDGTLAVIGGIRFPNEADAVRAAGGVMVKVERPGTAEADTTDPTERERAAIQVDATIINNGSVVDLIELAQILLHDATAETLQPVYRATDAGLAQPPAAMHT